MAKTPELARNQRVSGSERTKLGTELLKRYEKGQSIREICSDTGYSIGRVRRLLLDAGVEFRGRGGTQGRPRRNGDASGGTAKASTGRASTGRASTGKASTGKASTGRGRRTR